MNFKLKPSLPNALYDELIVSCDVRAASNGGFNIQVWYDDGQVNGWNGESFTGFCKYPGQEFKFLVQDFHVGWIWVHGTSANEAIIQVSTLNAA